MSLNKIKNVILTQNTNVILTPKAEGSRPKFLHVVFAAITFLLAACGDETTINQMGMEVVSSVDDLPKCTGSNEGEQAWVKGEPTVRICTDGEWFALSGETSNGDFSCKTEELKDKSGLKIVCNGDSIGVVLNGASGAGCMISAKTDTSVTLACGDSTIVMAVGSESGISFLDSDSERVAVSLDSLVGYTQKGPFLKGSTVYLYELSDGRTLKQTNGNFTSKITSDDGRYKFSARDLVSQYAMVVVDGYYRNEVTGGTSDAPIRLTALTDMRKRSSVNVNLLTHMEFDRVYNLVTHGDSTGKKLTVKAAKRQAQKEILKQFHIELDENIDAEDMDVFGDSDADAALLAVSVLLQGDSSSSALSVLLTEISNDISGYGEWKNAATKAKLADWALTADSLGKLSVFGQNVTDWGLGDAPDFAKFVRRYSSIESGLGVCGEGDNKVGVVKQVTNMNSKEYYAASYTDASNKIRFICVDADSAKWRVATDIEKDTYGEKCTADSVGKVVSGMVTATNKYYCTTSGWVSLMGDWSWDFPKEARLNPEITYGTMTDTRDNKVYKTVKIGDQTWMAENLNYADSIKTPSLLNRSWCYLNKAENCAVTGRLYTWAASIDSVALYDDGNGVDCGYGKTCTLSAKVQGVCPDGWHLPTQTEWNTLFTEVGGQTTAGRILKSQTGWISKRNGTDGVGFSALPAGLKDDGSFHDDGNLAYFWSASDIEWGSAYGASLNSTNYNYAAASLEADRKVFGFSVRCLQD